MFEYLKFSLLGVIATACKIVWKYRDHLVLV